MGMTSNHSDVAILDANVLIYAHLKTDPRNSDCVRLIDLACTAEQRFAVTPQILFEFYAFITSQRNTDSPYSIPEAQQAIDQLVQLAGLFVLTYPSDLVTRTQMLLDQKPVTDRAIFDLQIAATMLFTGIKKIYTYDRTGFTGIDGIEVVVPSSPSVSRAA